MLYNSYGDARTPEGNKLLAESSPIHRVEHAKGPILIVHGEKDSRCTVDESNIFVKALMSQQVPTTYIVFPEEGHGFSSAANRLAYVGLVEVFFEKHLGGRLEQYDSGSYGANYEVRCDSSALLTSK